MKFIKKIYKKFEILNESFMDHKKILEMRSRLQMLIALILFTPVILTSLGPGTLQKDKMTLTWGIIVAMYIGIYIFCEALGGRLNKLNGNVINWSVWTHLTKM